MSKESRLTVFVYMTRGVREDDPTSWEQIEKLAGERGLVESER